MRRTSNSAERVSTAVLVISLAGLYALLFYAPLMQVLTFLFKARDFSGGVSTEWSLRAFGAYDYSALWYASLWTLTLVIPITVCVSLAAAHLSAFLRVWFGIRGVVITFASMAGLVCNDGILKAVAYSAAFPFPVGPFAYVVLSAMMITPFAVAYLCFSVYRMDAMYIDVARDLGAKDAVVVRKIVLPLLLPSIKALVIVMGVLLVFNIIYSEAFLGGKHLLLVNLIKLQFLEQSNWPAAVLTVIISIAVTALVVFSAWLLTNLFLDKGACNEL